MYQNNSWEEVIGKTVYPGFKLASGRNGVKIINSKPFFDSLLGCLKKIQIILASKVFSAHNPATESALSGYHRYRRGLGRQTLKPSSRFSNKNE